MHRFEPAAFLGSDGVRVASRQVFRLARAGACAYGCGSAPDSDRLSPPRAYVSATPKREQRSQPNPGVTRAHFGPAPWDAGPKWCDRWS